ncbi:pyridoxal phosphate-dependent aminotransferase [Salinactinospora qingdaonensis]|uniref:Aminotransferase class I/classII large domain-containing protein n=1 Tax=Salinactinospora qingdaonensis TaxID=702744 RepID=A0ABP7GA51_9ACTN
MMLQNFSSEAAAGLEEQRMLVRQARKEILQRHRARLGESAEPPIRVMARIVQDLERECVERNFDQAAIRHEIVNRTIGDVNVRLINECEGEAGGPEDFRLLGDELGIALPGEDLNGYTASGEGYRWLREQMLEAERHLLSKGHDLRVYDIHGVGNPVLRGWLADDMQHWGLTASAQHVAVGLGATDCIDKVLRGFARLSRLQSQPPGAVLFAAPGFNMPELQATSHGYRLHSVNTRAEDDFKLTGPLLSQTLEENPDINIVYLAVTNNPTTFAYSPDELSSLQDVIRRFAQQGRRIYILADLAYVGTGPPADDQARMQSLTSAADIADQMIYVSSWSKTHTLTGERFGWIVFGDTELAGKMGSSWTNSVASLPGEWQLRFMAYHALFRENPQLIEKIRKLYRLRRSRLREQLEKLDKEHRLFEQIYLDDDVTIYNWSKLREGEDSFSVFEKTGLAGIPGSTFGYSDDYIRFSVGILPVATD